MMGTAENRFDKVLQAARRRLSLAYTRSKAVLTGRATRAVAARATTTADPKLDRFAAEVKAICRDRMPHFAVSDQRAIAFGLVDTHDGGVRYKRDDPVSEAFWLGACLRPDRRYVCHGAVPTSPDADAGAAAISALELLTPIGLGYRLNSACQRMKRGASENFDQPLLQFTLLEPKK